MATAKKPDKNFLSAASWIKTEHATHSTFDLSEVNTKSIWASSRRRLGHKYRPIWVTFSIHQVDGKLARAWDVCAVIL